MRPLMSGMPNEGAPQPAATSYPSRRSSLRLYVGRFLTLWFCAPLWSGAAEDRWWPVQAMPQAVVRTSNQESRPDFRLAADMLIQSVASLAAKAVNEDKAKEMVWVDNGNIDMEDWYNGMLRSHPEV